MFDYLRTDGGCCAAEQARAQQPALPVIGFLDARSPDAVRERLRAFRQGLYRQYPCYSKLDSDDFRRSYSRWLSPTPRGRPLRIQIKPRRMQRDCGAAASHRSGGQVRRRLHPGLPTPHSRKLPRSIWPKRSGSSSLQLVVQEVHRTRMELTPELGPACVTRQMMGYVARRPALLTFNYRSIEPQQ